MLLLAMAARHRAQMCPNEIHPGASSTPTKTHLLQDYTVANVQNASDIYWAVSVCTQCCTNLLHRCRI